MKRIAFAPTSGALQDLPIVLRDLQRGLEYQLHGPASSGLLIDGFWKYVGIGLAQRSLQEMLGFKEVAAAPSLILEVRTCFVSEKVAFSKTPQMKIVSFRVLKPIPKIGTQVAKSCGQFAEFSHLLHDALVGTQEFANFVPLAKETQSFGFPVSACLVQRSRVRKTFYWAGWWTEH